MSIVEITVAGEPRERGRQHGTQLRAEIGGLYERWLACGSRQAPPIGEDELLAFAEAHVAPACAYAPAWVEEIAGIAEGARLAFEQAFLLSCWDELCSWFSVHGDRPLAAGCTSFASRRPEVLIAQNQDAWRWWRPVVVVHSHPSDGTPSAVYGAHPGVLTTLGVNEHGIGLVANSLLPADRGVGVPFAVVAREALAQRTLADALAAILRAPRATGANFILASEEAAVDVEVSHEEADVTYVADVLAHANHYLCPRLAGQDVGAALLPDSYLREGRMRSMLRDAPPDRPEDAISLLSDHEGAPTSICRHPAAQIDDMETLGAVVVVPGERALYVTDGPPCRSDVLRFEVVAADAVVP